MSKAKVNDYEIDEAFGLVQYKQVGIIRKLRDRIDYLENEHINLLGTIMSWKPFIDDMAKAHQALKLDESDAEKTDGAQTDGAQEGLTSNGVGSYDRSVGQREVKK